MLVDETVTDSAEGIGATPGNIEVTLSIQPGHGPDGSFSDLSGYDPDDGLPLLDAIYIAVERVVVWVFLAQPKDARVSVPCDVLGVVSFTGEQDHEVLEMVLAANIAEAYEESSSTGFIIVQCLYANEALRERLVQVDFRDGMYIGTTLLETDLPTGAAIP